MGKSLIHNTAIVDDQAVIGNNVTVGPYTIIGPDVIIGDDNVIENHVTIKGKTTIGHRNNIAPYVSIGLSAQDKAHRHEPTKVQIGDDNEIREYVSIHRGTLGGTGITKLGDSNELFISVHLAHDTLVGNNCMLANNTTLGGHVQVGSHVVTGGMSGFHQFCRIGDYAMLGGYSVAYQDVPPYMICTGTRAQLLGINLVGLERNGITAEQIGEIQKMHQIFFNSGLVPKKAIETLQQQLQSSPILDRFLDFINNSKRGIISKGLNEFPK
jgi:UDP-N-acetylglucosamine acyltransferase